MGGGGEISRVRTRRRKELISSRCRSLIRTRNSVHDDGGLGSGEATGTRGAGKGRKREGGSAEDRWKFDSGRKGRINGAGGTHRGHKSPARPGITGSQLAKYDGLINPSPLARAPPSTTSTSPAPSPRSVLLPLAALTRPRREMEDTRGALSRRIYVSARRATAIYNLRAWKSEVHNLIRSFRSA